MTEQTTEVVRPMPFGEFTRELLALYEPPLAARNTQKRMGQILTLAAQIGSPQTTADMNAMLVARYVGVRSRLVCSNSLIGELGYLKAACNHARAAGYIARNPFDSRRLRIRPEPSRRAVVHHPIEDVRRVLEHLKRESAIGWKDHRLFALASTVAYTGLRRDEALTLKVEDVDVAAGVLAVVARARLKTSASAQPVPMPPPLAACLVAWLPATGPEWLFPTVRRTGPWRWGSASNCPLGRLKAAGEAVGVPGLTWLSLRHSWATHAETAWGLSEPAIQRVLRHTRPLTQLRYRHADLANLRAIGERVSFGA